MKNEQKKVLITTIVLFFMLFSLCAGTIWGQNFRKDCATTTPNPNLSGGVCGDFGLYWLGLVSIMMLFGMSIALMFAITNEKAYKWIGIGMTFIIASYLTLYAYIVVFSTLTPFLKFAGIGAIFSLITFAYQIATKHIFPNIQVTK